MSVATHLGIKLTEYDSRIRIFIPHYEEMLDVASGFHVELLWRRGAFAVVRAAR